MTKEEEVDDNAAKYDDFLKDYFKACEDEQQ